MWDVRLTGNSIKFMFNTTEDFILGLPKAISKVQYYGCPVHIFKNGISVGTIKIPDRPLTVPTTDPPVLNKTLLLAARLDAYTQIISVYNPLLGYITVRGLVQSYGDNNLIFNSDLDLSEIGSISRLLFNTKSKVYNKESVGYPNWITIPPIPQVISIVQTITPTQPYNMNSVLDEIFGSTISSIVMKKL